MLSLVFLDFGNIAREWRDIMGEAYQAEFVTSFVRRRKHKCYLVIALQRKNLNQRRCRT